MQVSNTAAAPSNATAAATAVAIAAADFRINYQDHKTRPHDAFPGTAAVATVPLTLLQLLTFFGPAAATHHPIKQPEQKTQPQDSGMYIRVRISKDSPVIFLE